MALGWLAAARNSWDGLRHGWQHERPFRQEVVAFGLGAAVTPFVAGSALHAIALLGALLFVIVVELLNNAVEALADRITTERDEAIRIAKDSGSAAVLIAIAVAAALWLEAILGALIG